MIRYSFLKDYSGCFVKNGLHRSKTGCGETSREAITEVQRKTMRAGTRMIALTVGGYRQVFRK